MDGLYYKYEYATFNQLIEYTSKLLVKEFRMISSHELKKILT